MRAESSSRLLSAVKHRQASYAAQVDRAQAGPLRGGLQLNRAHEPRPLVSTARQHAEYVFGADDSEEKAF